MKIKYLGYGRKSSEKEDQQVQSIQSQEDELNSLAERLKLPLEKIYTESKSAKQPGNRPIFNNILEKIAKEGNISLLAWHPDRLSRNTEELGRIITLIDSGKLVEVITPRQTFRNIPMDKFMLGFLMLQAKLENDNKGVNVIRGLTNKAKIGWLPNGAKPGYMNDKYEEKGNKKIMPDPIRFPLVRKALKLVATGDKTPMEAFDLLNNEWGYTTPKKKKIGGKPMTRSNWYEVLKDSFYYGPFEFPKGSGNFFKGNHKKMITKEEFDLIQIRLGSKGRKSSKKKLNFAYTGLMNCGECKASITADEKWQLICSTCKEKFATGNKDSCPKCKTIIENMADPKILHYVYYHCTKRKNPNCSQGAIEVKKLEKMIDEILSKIEISERFKNWAIKNLQLVNKDKEKTNDEALKSIEEKYKDTKARLSNLVQLKISPHNTDGSLLTDEDFKAAKGPLNEEIKQLEERKKSLKTNLDQCIELSEDTFNFACYARYHFKKGTPKIKSEIFKRVGSNLEFFEKVLRADIKKPLKLIAETIENQPSISPMIEPEKKIDLSDNYELLWDSNPSLLSD